MNPYNGRTILRRVAGAYTAEEQLRTRM